MSAGQHVAAKWIYGHAGILPHSPSRQHTYLCCREWPERYGKLKLHAFPFVHIMQLLYILLWIARALCTVKWKLIKVALLATGGARGYGQAPFPPALNAQYVQYMQQMAQHQVSQLFMPMHANTTQDAHHDHVCVPDLLLLLPGFCVQSVVRRTATRPFSHNER